MCCCLLCAGKIYPPKTTLLLCVIRMPSFVFPAHLLVEHPGIGGDGVLQSLSSSSSFIFYFLFFYLFKSFSFFHTQNLCNRITVELVEPGCVCMSWTYSSTNNKSVVCNLILQYSTFDVVTSPGLSGACHVGACYRRRFLSGAECKEWHGYVMSSTPAYNAKLDFLLT